MESVVAKRPVAEPARGLELSAPDITAAEIAAVAEVLQSGRLALGPRLTEFERRVADCVGVRHAVAVNSGTSALHLLVRALGLGEGDEVITTPFSFIASANCLLYERVRPVFADIEPDTLNLDVSAVARAITPRTKAILAVDVFGRPAAWEELRALAREHGLALIEDSCEALGARYQRGDGTWAMAGALGDVGCFAFYPNKQITTGEGGMVVTDRDDLAALCRSMRNQGRDEGPSWLQHARLGYNYRLSEVNCALGLAQMQRLKEILAARAQVARWYEEALTGIAGLETPQARPREEISWFVYVVRLASCTSREELETILTALHARGVACSNYFPPIHLQPSYRSAFGYTEGDFPVTEAASCQTVALPFYTRLGRDDVVWVAEQVRAVLASRYTQRPM